MDKVAQFLASGFYSGYLPKAPGTWGTIAAFIIAGICERVFGETTLLYLAIGSFFLGWVVSQYLINKNPINSDPSYIVIDEFAGSFLLLWLLHGVEPLTSNPLMLYGLGFILFRFFDVTKIFPIQWVEERLARNIKWAGFGVMIDDVFAALYPFLIIQSILIFR